MRFRIASLCVAIAVGLSPRMSAADGLREVFQHENVLGTSLELKVASASSAEASRAETVALTEIDRLSGLLSTYDPRSEVSRWLATTGQVTRLSPELAAVLGLFDQWRDRTGGALNPAAEAANRLWKAAGAAGQEPSAEALQSVAAAMGRPHWTLDAATREAVHLDATPIALNSLTKSFILGRVAEAVLRSGAARGVVVNLGGDLVVRGDWTETVAIADPAADAENSPALRRITVTDRAVATSGRYRRGVSVAGRWRSHMIDPRTGRPADAVASATVAAADAAEAGALATAFCVMSPDESLRLAAGLTGVECLLVTGDGRQVASPGWLALESPRVQVAAAGDAPVAVPRSAASAGGGRTWDTNLELVVTLEVARIDGGRARRPFVAVWVEDQDKFPVRTIALWFKGSRWLPDLRSWHHSDQLRAITDGTDLTASVSSATRSPGKYTLQWDGRDDKGVLVKPGRYTVYIEAAREHGTHQLMRQEFTFDGTPQRVELKGNPEMAGATLDYRRKVAAP